MQLKNGELDKLKNGAEKEWWSLRECIGGQGFPDDRLR